ncbi:hypothetical protein KO495_02975 [Colwellia sp. D2M02]|uniref:Secreted protein n=1 Tax=Colwellia asteriadis TaxID=517723 RepID=A0ABN1L746_9GAMM|nr:hypothetical protein [Colwellia sp. D2M02]MBU2892283.1 hypothetical protein [Colwellia sp. D2M02]
MNKLLMMSKVFALTAVLTMFGCSDGPAEDAGEKVDEVVSDSKNAVEDACEKAKELAGAEKQDC